MSVLLEKLSKEGSVPLERYGHQVGGHHMLFKFQDVLCKPVVSREHFFYQTAPPVMKRYIPTYHGVINVRYVAQDSGQIQVVASPRDQPDPVPPSREVGNGGGLSNNEVAKSWMRGNFPKCTTGATIHSAGTSITSRHVDSSESYNNPWAIMCSQNMDERLKELGGDLDSFTKDYMILENLTIKYSSPCVLDLKVGTRQHGDDATSRKVQKHIYTCANSTSSSLGVRMAGMQKYNALKKEYTFYDKYFGKQLTEGEFREVILTFFENELCFRSDIFPQLVRMLRNLRASIKALPTFRYFSSSLLVLYDGAQCPEGLPRSAGTGRNFDHIIQRARQADEADINYSSENLARMKDQGRGGDLAQPAHAEGQLNGSRSPTTDECTDTTGLGMRDLMSDEELAQARKVVDLRMIDFAHATHEGYKDPLCHPGFDDSYLVGLDYLIDMFTEMKKQHYCENGHGL